MTLESLINFKMGMRVMRNPDNHGLETFNDDPRLGTVGRIVTKHIEGDGYFRTIRTGEIWVMWDGDNSHRIVRYENLKIVG